MTALREHLQRWPAQLLLVIAVVLGIRAYQLRGVANGPAPALQLASVALGGAGDPNGAGAQLTLPVRAGHPTLVYFWATWCGVCNVVDPNVASVAADHDVITIAVQSGDATRVRAFLEEHDLSMPTGLDPDGRVAASWGVRAFPTTFWVDAGGEVRHREVGYTTTAGMLARLWWIR